MSEVNDANIFPKDTLPSETQDGDDTKRLDKPTNTTVNSTAMVLYEGPKSMPLSGHFQWLDPGINLTIPPNNWLRAGSPLEKYVHQALYTGTRIPRSHMSSIDMATDHLDMVDDIDVISDAKNIKSLLGVTFSKEEPLSLMVHRVGKTLLIDEFDIHKHLLRKQQDDWSWMNKLSQQIGAEQFSRPQRSQRRLEEKNMFSKFLYYSIKDEEAASQLVSRPDSSEGDSASEFSRTFRWNFENIKMLIGSDLPIFNDGSSCVSLHLRDMNTPITVLTGLDYWLDNLMCNVPEIAMCYHLGGFVQKYERIPTSDIPTIDGAEFEPNYVKDIAQNILSFLKSSATKVGHTYWLYKGKNGDIVKLYDLTSLCGKEDGGRQPFRIPLANLLFRVAAKLHKKRDPSKSGTIEALLTNALILLNGEQSQMSVNAHLILSELYLAEDDLFTCESMYGDDISDTGSESSGDMDEESTISDDADPMDSMCTEMDMTSLSKPVHSHVQDAKFPPIKGSLEARCKLAIKVIASGLVSVDRAIDDLERKATTEQSTAKSYEAIPLPYEPLFKEKTLSQELVEEPVPAQPSGSTVQLVIKRQGLFADTWHRLSKISLLRKAMFACYKLADAAYLIMEHGNALKYTKLALMAYDALRCLDNGLPGLSPMALGQKLFPLVMRLCGDIQMRLATKQSVDLYMLDYNELSDNDEIILASCIREIPVPSYTYDHKMYRNQENRLLVGLHCYELCKESLGMSKDEEDLIVKRLGNGCNELAVFYMNKAAQNIENAAKLLSASEKYLAQGIEFFGSISDRPNMALLTSNNARLLRIKAQICAQPERQEFTMQERQIYDKAAEKYLEALSLLAKRENCAQIWDLITFDLSGVYCTIASLLQDYTPLSIKSRVEVERDVTNLMLKALKYCDSGGVQDVMRQYRAATIHHRLASLFHNAFRSSQISDPKYRQLRSMTESHYNKAQNLFIHLDSHMELMRVLLERVALYEFEFNAASAVRSKQRLMETGLNLLLDDNIKSCLQSFCSTADQATDESEGQRLLSIYGSRLQYASLQLVKLTNKCEKTPDNMKEHYKSVYRQSLKITTSGTLAEQSEKLLQIISSIPIINRTASN